MVKRKSRTKRQSIEDQIQEYIEGNIETVRSAKAVADSVLAEQIRNILVEINSFKTELTSIKNDLRSLNELSNRWKGALFVILCLGAFIGWLTTLGRDYLLHWMK